MFQYCLSMLSKFKTQELLRRSVGIGDALEIGAIFAKENSRLFEHAASFSSRRIAM